MARKNIDRNSKALITKVAIAVLLVIFMAYAAIDRQQSHLTSVSVNIKSRGEVKHLISKKEVLGLLRDELGYEISIASISKVILYDLEEMLESDERVSRAEIYIDKHNRMIIGIIQNLPIARIEVTGGEDYYLDHSGGRIIKTDEHVRVPVVTGYVDNYTDGFLSQSENNLNYILSVARKIHDDSFLNALVQQIHMTEEDEIVLVPTLGREKITLGPTEGLDDKIYKLKTYYKEGVKHMGVDRFTELDLSYDGQIRAVKTDS